MKCDLEKQEQFNKYYDLLIDWNNKINLTAITDKDEVWLKHFEDSVSIDQIIDMNSVESIIDIGTGAGFPGIPLKIMYPHLKVTLLDSLNKRINFLNTVIDELELENVLTIHGRAEDFGHDEIYREKYDMCVSRAVANLNSLSELCIPFVKVGGRFVSYKSEKAEEEMHSAANAISLLGGAESKCLDVSLSDSSYNRKVIIINKVSSTSMKYPRKAGIPVKKPL